MAKKKVTDDLATADKIVQSNAAATDAAKVLIEQFKPPAPSNAAPSSAPITSVQKVSDAVASASIYNEQARSLREQAQAAIEAADATKDPARKSQLYLDAMSKMEASLNAARTAADSLGSVGRPTPSKTTWPALEDLRRRAAAGAPGSGLNVDVFEATLARVAEAATPPRNAGTNAFSIKSYDQSTGKAMLGDGTILDLTLLQKAARTYSQGGASGPLIREVPLPTGTAFIADGKSREALASAARRTDGVGGVALRVTLAALQSATGADQRLDTAFVEVDKPVLISLGRLYDQLKPHAQSPGQWSALPAELRYPGNIARILGFIAGPDTDDIWIIGNRATTPEARIDVDTIILAARAAHRGETPSVSLDRLPNDDTGPNYPRVIGIPADSSMAKVMLDADYLMKRILLGTVKPAVDGYRSLANISETGGYTDLNFHSRFWFQPQPLGPGSVRRSGSRRTILFDAELQVLTESEKAGELPTPAGAKYRTPPEHAAAEFSRKFKSIAGDRQADPGRLFERLQGISDAMALAQMMLNFGQAAGQLEAMAGLPYRKLAATETAPREYPIVSKSLTVMAPDGSVNKPRIFGGVTMRLGMERRSLSSGYNVLLEALEEMVSSQGKERGAGRWLIEVPFSLQVPTPDSDARMKDSESAFTAGMAAFNAGDDEGAVRQFNRAVEADPLSARATAWLAYAKLWAGDSEGAVPLALRAKALDPEDTLVTALAYDVARRTAPDNVDVPAPPPATTKRLVELYLELGLAGRAARDNAFTDWFEEAVDLDPENSDARIGFGFGKLWAKEPDVDAAMAAFQSARDTLLSRGREMLRNDPAGRLDYVVASLGSALAFEARVLLGLHEFDRRYPFVDPFKREQIEQMARALLSDTVRQQIEAARRSRLEPLVKAADQQFQAASEALEFQSNGTIAGVQLLARVHRFEVNMRLLKRDALLQELKSMRAEADRYVARYPGSDLVHGARATLMLDIGEGDAALADIDRAIASNPGGPGNIAMKGRILVAMGRCEEARVEIARAKAINPAFDMVDERYRLRCGG
ncbi:MAG: DUF1598 domain-containing protein [Proteobacteria bacterium]|nr:DUF1598 domain-containing protein [Pseudomonadota bacterium]